MASDYIQSFFGSEHLLPFLGAVVRSSAAHSSPTLYDRFSDPRSFCPTLVFAASSSALLYTLIDRTFLSYKHLFLARSSPALRRTSPLRLRKSDGGKRRSSSRPLSATFGGNTAYADTTTFNNSASNLLHAPVTVTAAPAAAGAAGSKSTETNGNHVAAGSAAVSSQDAAANRGVPASGGGGGGGNGAALISAWGGGGSGGDVVQPILLSWEDIDVPLPGGGKGGDPAAAAILTGVSGFAGPGTAGSSSPADAPAWSGSVTAIMGPSGAGKTTLLNVLAGRMHHLGKNNSIVPLLGGKYNGRRVTGAVRINGRAATAAEVRGISGYVTQEDVLPETLTCFEHLMFHAELRMSTPEAGTGGCGCGGGAGRRLRASREDRKRRVLQVWYSPVLQTGVL